MDIPIGEYFELFVKGLKSNFGGFFGAVSHTIDMAITVIEQILAVNPEVWFSSVVIVAIIALLVVVLVKRTAPIKLAIAAGIVTILALGSLDVWRRGAIAQTVTAEEAAQTIGQLETLKAGVEDSLESTQLRTLDRVLSRLNAVKTSRVKKELLGERTYSRYLALETEMEPLVADRSEAVLTESFTRVKQAMKDYNPNAFGWYAWLMVMVMLALLAWVSSGKGLAIFALIGMSLIQMMGFWGATTDTLALVISATGFALALGVPLGIAAAANKTVDQVSKPILDFMQTMPAFVYLIPAVLLFGLGKVPGAMATLIFAMPPAVRLTSLGIRSVPTEVVEAAQSFGSTPMQLLFKAQLPIALPTILAGLNQTIMLSLSMVVIGGMIGAGGLGEVVLSGITQLKIGLGFESGLSVVILAIYLDRLTQSLGSYKS
jgi:glycine betaine/proline transport system permease protein